MTQRFLAYIRILRPLNFLFVFIAVLFGVYYKIQAFPLLYPVLAALAAALISGGGYVINDYYDYSIDVINRNERVLPSGLISKIVAKFYALLLFTVGILISIFIRNPWMIALAILNTLLLYFYALKGKQLHFFGNLLVAFITASTFIFGSFITGNFSNAIFVALCAFFYTFIREIVKDIEDKEGDSSTGSKTLPLIWGNKKTLIVAFLSWIGLLVVIIWAYPRYYTLTFLIIILISIVLLLLLDIVILYITQNKKLIKFSERYMKIHMLIFLVILWVAQ
ncbi:MAG: geranylgeranylglycerol-phosphate geranylgeranyltransferase [Candidatus Cloacimonetes bacterium]|nr:geranylgeranylglycerol-phosphate geranylgeranyltransferase [Candidatus Cloacimonadota bacterium]